MGSLIEVTGNDCRGKGTDHVMLELLLLDLGTRYFGFAGNPLVVEE